MTRRDQPSTVTDTLLGFVLVLGGILLAAGGVLQLVPSVYALGALALAAGVVAILGSFVGRTQAGFWSELVPGALLLTFGVLVVRFPDLGARGLALLAAAVFLTNGLVRLGSARMFPSLARVFLVGGLVSLLMGGLVLSDVVPVTTHGVAILIGSELIVDGVIASLVSRADHPSKRRG